MEVIFTKSESMLSKVIRAVTKEPVSHCAIQIHSFVIHSNLLGVHVESREHFLKHSTVVLSVPVVYSPKKVLLTLSEKEGSLYDFGALLYLGLRYAFPFLPKKNLWQTSGMYLCTEWITEVIDSKQDSEITPYGLYLRLVANNKGAK